MAFLRYGLVKRRGRIGWFVGAVLFVYILLLASPPPEDVMKSHWQRWDYVATFSTLFVSVLIWYDESQHAWTAQLPMRLTVQFQHQGKTLLLCKDAYLAGEADIRQWGQQIGRQMVGGGGLEFGPFVQQEELGLQFRQGIQVKAYAVTFELLTLNVNRAGTKAPSAQSSAATAINHPVQEVFNDKSANGGSALDLQQLNALDLRQLFDQHVTRVWQPGDALGTSVTYLPWDK